MNIYESLNYISKLAFPKIKYGWSSWSIIDEKPIFQISIVSNEIEDYVISYYEKGLKALLNVIINEKLTPELKYYGKQLLVVLADQAINYHSDISKNKPEIACKLYKKYPDFRETIIEYSPYLYRLLSNIIASSFFRLDFKTIKDVCENCLPKINDLKIKKQKYYREFISCLHDEFTYNHSFEFLVTEENAKKYWEIAEYVNNSIPDLNFYSVRDGEIIYEIYKDIVEMKSLKPLIKLMEKECFWINKKNIPKYVIFDYMYPNGINGDIIKYILDEHGETFEIEVNKWQGKISKEYLSLLEVFSLGYTSVTQDERFLKIFQDYHVPTILSTRLWDRCTTKSHKFTMFKLTEKVLHNYKAEQKSKRELIYSQLLTEGKASPKWKSEFQLYKLSLSLYPDSIYQYQPTWLGLQSLDIYIPSIGVGIEYQGIQHYKPIEHFGGEKHFLHRQANDKKKKILCKENGVKLLEWPYTTDITEDNFKKYILEILTSK